MRVCLLFLFLLFLLPAYAGQPLPAGKKTLLPARLHTDSASQIVPKHFNTAYLQQLRQLPEFQYQEDLGGPSVWERFKRWLRQLLQHFNISPQSQSLLGNLFEYLIIIIGALALVFLILRLAGINIYSLMRREPPGTNLPYQENLENIHEIDFDTSLEQALGQHNYRLAVRLLYLKSLKQLADGGLIHWQINKTNYQYLNEINNPEQRETFGVLTRQFEYVWYGDFAINEQSYQNISNLFTRFKQTLA